MIFNTIDNELMGEGQETGNQRIIPIVQGGSDENITLNDGEILDVLPLRNTVLFPGVLIPVSVTRPKSMKLIKAAYENGKLIATCCQKQKDTQDPEGDDLYDLGTAAKIVQTIEMQSGTLMVILEGVERIHVEEFIPTKTGLEARITRVLETFPKTDDKEFIALASSVKDQASEILKNSEELPQEASVTLRSLENPLTLINYVCTTFDIQIEDKQGLLQVDQITERGVRLMEILSKIAQLQKMKNDIKSKTREQLDKQQREYFLHQQMETIQKELGGDNSATEIINEMKKRAADKKWSKEVQTLFDKELQKLQRTPTLSQDYAIQQNYLETILDLPWNEYTQDKYDLHLAQSILDKNHYGMEKVKERIVEYLAVRAKLALRNVSNDNFTSPILCLYGPPGVGKTSLCKSIAESLNRKYTRISLGGLRDEAEIRGHRRTYIGAMPGRIIENIKKVQSSNPVFVLDEIDKVGADYKGDPTSALLEVLDPEQNKAFHDNFLDIDYDLSKVLFIATANSLDSIPRPLLDRMELIEMNGYMIEEKIEIAKRHLIPQELEKSGLDSKQLKFKKDVITHIIDDYTRESGVRSLDKQIAAICRKVDTKIMLGEPYNETITEDDVITYLGQPRFSRDKWETNKYVGVVTGLAWTQVGGEILFIEASLSPSKTPTLTLTGNLGDVMKESATLALGYIKAHASQFSIPQKSLDTQSIHIHVPEGAVPKDGPSAGITITTALISAFTKRKVRQRVAMTGEMTLRGKVLPIGGVKEKILAAKRAGITDLVLCEDNRKDICEIEEKYLKGLTFHYVKDIAEVIDFALL